MARDALWMVCAGLLAGTLMVQWGRPLAARLVQDLKPGGAGPLALAGAAIAAVALRAA